MAILFGTNHRLILDWLEQEWWHKGPPVCVIEGFPGVGKTRIAEELLERLGADITIASMIDCPEAGIGLMDDMLLTLAEKLSEQGDQRLAESLNESTLKTILSKPALLVIDEFQRGFQPETGRPVPPLSRFLEEIALKRQSGRILLLSSRDLDRERWSERIEVRTLSGLPPDEASEFLGHLLHQNGLVESIPPERRLELATWLGGFPRALTLLANRLRYEPIDELVGLAAEAWEARDRKVSRKLLERFEVEMFQRARTGLVPAVERFLRRLAVFRHPVENAAMERILDPGTPLVPMRDELVARFMIELRRNRYAMPSILRDAVLANLSDEAGNQAHRMAGDWFARHFRAKQIVGAPEKLGGAFVEARYHFVQGKDDQALREIGQGFEAHVRAIMGWITPLPSNAEELDERIAFLSALLSDGNGSTGLHFYLAKLLANRRRQGDLERAAHHAKKGTGPQSPSEAWVQRIRLEAELNGPDCIPAILHEHARRPEPYTDAYLAAATELDRSGKTDEAVALLREGIGKIGPHQSLQSLYQSAGEMLDRSGKTDEAVALLREGIGKIGPHQNLQSLYQSAGEMLDRSGKTDEALALLREGIGKIGPHQNLFMLYQSAGKILNGQGRTQEALQLFQEGLGAIPKGKNNRYRLACSFLYMAYAASDEFAIKSALNTASATILDPPQQMLGRILLRELAGDWTGAADIATTARAEFTRFPDLAVRESFSRLCSGESTMAEDALKQFPRLTTAPAMAAIWLQSFIALQAGDLPRAQERLSFYLGKPVSGDTATLRQRLLQVWDDSPQIVTHQTLTYYFPHLPPVLTDLQDTITRRHYGPSVLPNAPLDTTQIMTLEPTVMNEQRTTTDILAIATEWFSRHGGLSTFNRDLCLALHQAGHRVVCLVPAVTPEEDAHAIEHGITLISARGEPGMDDKTRLCRRPPLPDGFDPAVIIGHDHITGIAAKVQADDFYPRAVRVHFIHTAPGEIEWFKRQGETTAAAKAEKKQREQEELALSAHLVVAVGPRLYAEFDTLLHGHLNPPPLHRLDPGLGELQPSRNPPPLAQCLLLGRTEDAELKGLDIAARALGMMKANVPSLIVRGAEQGKGDTLRDQLQKWACMPGLEIRTREYVPDTERLAEDLRRASLLLMPSRTEGFGLVALEALAAGTPILVSEKSGLASLLKERCGAEVAGRCIVPVTGDREIDATAWERGIGYLMQDRNSAFRNVREMAEALSKALTWEQAVQGFLEAIDSVEPPGAKDQ